MQEALEKKARTRGLTTEEVQQQRERFGSNEIIRQTKAHPLRMREFTSPLILLLIAAAIVSLAIGFLPD